MRTLNDTLTRLAALNRMTSASVDGLFGDHLDSLEDFGSNPGNLRARCFVPETLAANAPLVVVLHGCTQNPSAYDASAGWSKLAERHGFAVLFPEQQRANNPNLCFNWFTVEDTSRDFGEALSIRQMVAAMQARHGIDPDRIFVTGLSAGGAMAAVMLATYPEAFAGGAVIAGLPFGTAHSVPEAFDRMRGHGGPVHESLPELVRAASGYSGRWPTLSVWHGSDDSTVAPSNAAALVEQWRALHGASPAPSRTDLVHGYPHRVWCDFEGREVVEEYSISGLAHGTPLDTGRSDAEEKVGPYMLEAGISSTRLIARFWGIADAAGSAAAGKRAAPHPPAERPPSFDSPAQSPIMPPVAGVQQTIEDALRAAGLLK